ncbi:MAG: hypothetical protein GY711_18075 [bacterium]|nr:hypothetical protein [bacterium]
MHTAKTLLLSLVALSLAATPSLAWQVDAKVGRLLNSARKGSTSRRVDAMKELASLGRPGGDALGQLVLDFDDDTFHAALNHLAHMGPGSAAAVPHLIEATGGHRRANYTSFTNARMGSVLGAVGRSQSTKRRKGESKTDRIDRLRNSLDGLFTQVGKHDLEGFWLLVIEAEGACRVPSDDYSTLRVALVGAARGAVTEAVPLIERGLASEDPGALAAALFGTTCLDTNDLAPLLPRVLELLKHDDPNVRWRAAEAMGHFPDACSELEEALRAALTDESSHVRVRAAVALNGQCDTLEDIARIVIECTRAEHASARSTAATLLSKLKQPSPEVTQALGDLLGDESGYTVLMALRGLRRWQVDLKPYKRQLKRLTKHDDGRVIAAAKSALDSL